MQDHVVVQNYSPRRLEFELAFEIGNDFADIFAVKDWDFALGDPENARPLPPLAPFAFDPAETAVTLADANGSLPAA